MPDSHLFQPVYAVGAIVYRIENQQIEMLLIRKKGGSWSLPKGKLEGDENHERGVLRELKEETGLRGEVEDLVGEALYRVRKRNPCTKVVTYYLVRHAGGKLRPSREEKIEEVRWVPINQALGMLRRRPRLRTLLRAAQSMLAHA